MFSVVYSFLSSATEKLTLNFVVHGEMVYDFLSKTFLRFIFSFSAFWIYLFKYWFAGFFYPGTVYENYNCNISDALNWTGFKASLKTVLS